MTKQSRLPQVKSLFSRRNIAFLGMVIGMFMAILDMQIVASSLPVIASGLSASQDELSWIQTSYIIAEVVIIPLTGFTAKLLSTRISYVIAASGFTIMSVMCACSTNLETMIIARALQGLFGGAMIPTVFGVIYLIFEPKERPSVSIIIGLVVTMAPTLGPTIGGYITEILSWHYMFILNVVPGICVCVIVYLYADFDEPDYSLLKNLDYIGIFFLVTCLGSLQYVLEEGSKDQWFESNIILSLSIYAGIAFIILVYYELTTSRPILNLYAFKNENFRIGCALSMLLGIGLYGSVFLMPLFLGAIAGLNTIQIGIIMGVTGVSQFISAPLAGFCMEKGMDRRLMMTFGLGLFGIGCYLNSFLTADSRFYELIFPQFVRGISLMFCFVPINDITLGTLPKEEVQDASGLYNLMRNLGGAFGLAVINSTISNNITVNRDLIAANIPSTNLNVQNYIIKLKGMLSSMDSVSDPYLGALTILNSIIQREAFIIAINNMFAYVALLYVVAVMLIPFLKNTGKVEGGGH
jgi:MFS transporter, DHA2 family, multidrug resistance protein